MWQAPSEQRQQSAADGIIKGEGVPPPTLGLRGPGDPPRGAPLGPDLAQTLWTYLR